MQILLVEDDEINRLVALSILQNGGHQVEVAENGLQALEAVEARAFDVILMDRHMPEMGGLEATRRIRAMEGLNATLPVIGVTAAVDERDAAACLEAGMDDVITKPIDPAALAEVLARFGGGGSRRPAARQAPPGVVPESPLRESAAAVFDVATLAALRDDYGDEMASRLIAEFRQFSTETGDRLRAAAKNNDIEIVERSAHDLKSNARTLGLQRLSDHCRGIELACKEGRLEDARRGIDHIDALLAEALGALERDTRMK